MIVIPAVITALSAVAGTGGLVLNIRGQIDQASADATIRYVQEQNERDCLRFTSVSERLDSELKALGKQRLAISKNFSTFVKAFEKIHNTPEFTSMQNPNFSAFSFDELASVTVWADSAAITAVGAMAGSVFGAAAAGGVNSALWALGKAQLGAKASRLHGYAKSRAILSTLGGGAKRIGGGGIAMGKLVLNFASAGTLILVEGLAMSFSASLAKKNADEAKKELQKNRQLVSETINMQLELAVASERLRTVSVLMCNRVYKDLVKRFKELVNQKTDWNTFTTEEKKLVENCVLTVQLLHNLNNTPMYTVTEYDVDGEIKSAEPNINEVNKMVYNARAKINEEDK